MVYTSLKWEKKGLGAVAHVCNSQLLGRWRQEDHWFKVSPSKGSEMLFPEQNTATENRLGPGSVVVLT
jgi:hypothetical protein